MYFDQNFPVIIYDAVGNGEFKDVTNILRRVALRAKVKSNALLFDTYDIKEGETPESVADKLYDDPELHWVIMITNNITDRYHQWPMNYSQFLQYLNDKYDDVDGTHHYEISTTKIEVYNNSALYSGDTDFYNNATIVTNREYEESLQESRRSIRLLDPQYLPQFLKEFESLMGESII